MKTREIRNLSEDLEAIGLDGLDLELAGVAPLAEGDNPFGKDKDKDKDDDKGGDKDDDKDKGGDDKDKDGKDESEVTFAQALEHIVPDVYESIRSEISEDEIDYDVVEFEADLLAAITTLVEEHLSGLEEGVEIDLEEETRKIKVLRGGVLKTVRQKLAPRGDRIARRRENRKGRSVRNRKQRQARKRPAFQRYMKKRKRASRNEGEEVTGAAARIMSLLGESDASGDVELSGVHASLDEAYGRVYEVSDALAEFFEDHGDEEDYAIGTALTTMVEGLESDVSTLSEDGGEDDIEARLKGLQRYGKVIAEAVDVFHTYELVDPSVISDGGEEGND